MPYTKQQRRALYNGYIRSITNQLDKIYIPSSTVNSDMAYIIYKLIIDVYSKQECWDFKSDALKILEDVKLEYYERVLKPHADKKILENGDII